MNPKTKLKASGINLRLCILQHALFNNASALGSTNAI